MHGLEIVHRCVEHRAQLLLLTQRADTTRDVAGRAFGERDVGHRHGLHAQRVRHCFEIEVFVHRHNADAQLIAVRHNKRLEHLQRIDAEFLGGFESERLM